MKKLLLSSGLLVVFLALAWVVYGFFFGHGSDRREIYDKYFKPCLNYWTTNAEFKDTLSLARAAMNYYDKGNYQLAIEAFQRFEPEKKDEGYYNLYYGISYLKTDFDNLAISHLLNASTLFTDFNNIYMTKWFLALAYLKSNRESECVQLLDEIIRLNASYKSVAAQLETDLKGNYNPFNLF